MLRDSYTSGNILATQRPEVKRHIWHNHFRNLNLFSLFSIHLVKHVQH